MISKTLSSHLVRGTAGANRTPNPDSTASKPAPAEAVSPAKNPGNHGPDDTLRTTADRLLDTPSPLSRLQKASGQPDIGPSDRDGSASGNADLSPTLFPRLTLAQVLERSRSLPSTEASWRPEWLGPVGSTPQAVALAEDDVAVPATDSRSPDDRLADEIVDGVRSDIDQANDAVGSDPSPGQLDAQSVDSLNDHLVDATEQLERVTEIEDPEIRERVLKELESEIARLGELLIYVDLDKPHLDNAREIVDNLTRTTEALGSEQADLIAEPLAQGLQRSLHNNQTSVETARLFGESVIEGHGALLATRLDRFVDIDSDAHALLSNAALYGVGAVNADFERALEAKQQVDFQVAQFIFEWGDALTEDELQKAVDRIWEENADVTDELEVQSARLATLFEGVGSLTADGRLHAAGIGESELWDEVQSVRANLEPFAYTSFGQEYLAQGIAAADNGETNFVTNIAAFASVIDSGVGKADTVANLLVRTVAVRGAAYVQSGDIDSAIELFEGLEERWELLGLKDPAALEELTDDLRRLKSGELSAEDFADTFAEKAGQIEGTALRDGDSSVGKAFRLLGIGVGTASVIDQFRSADDFQSYLEAGIGTAGLAGEIGSLLPPGTRVGDFLSNFSRLAKLGPVFDTLAVVQAFNDGDVAQAGIAFAGLIGGFLVSSSSVGPLGTAVGAFLAAGAAVGGFALNAYRQNKAEDDTEALYGEALQAAGFTEEEANLLRDVSGDTRRSIGLIFSQIAANNPDFDTRELLDAFLDPGSAHGNIKASVAVDENGELLVDNRKQLIDLIESLDRRDNGYFTDESVQQAAVLFEQQLGISVDPSGLDAETSLDALEADFDNLDLNGDGQVSKGELQQILDDREAQGEYFGIPTEGQGDRPYVPERLADIARYFISREALIDRLDVGQKGGRGNGRISRDDIAAVREENEALRVVLENRDVFDVAHQGDPSKADQEISREDLEAVRDGDYSQALKDAARLLLENDRFFARVDTSDPEDVRPTTGSDDEEPTGDRKLTFTELALATLGHHAVLS